MTFRGITTPVGVFSVAPVTLGPATGTTAGELLRVAYTGRIEAATLTLADGRVLAFTVEDRELVVLLPPDTPDGRAVVRAAGVELELLLTGTIVIAPQPPAGGMPRARRPAPRRVIVTPSRVLVRSATIVRERRRRRALTELALFTATRIGRTAPPLPIVVAADTAVLLRTGTAIRGARVAQPTSIAVHAETAMLRRDGPSIEEALLLLDLV